MWVIFIEWTGLKINEYKLEIEKGMALLLANFLSVINSEWIIEVQESIKNFLHTDSLEGLSFLDIGMEVACSVWLNEN